MTSHSYLFDRIKEQLFSQVPLTKEHVGVFVYGCNCNCAVGFPVNEEQYGALLDVLKSNADVSTIRDAIGANIGTHAVNSIGRFIRDHYHHHGRSGFFVFTRPSHESN